MDDIAEGRKTLPDVVGDSRKLQKEVLEELEAHRQLIGTSIRDALKEQSIIGHCPQGQQGLSVRKAHRQAPRRLQRLPHLHRRRTPCRSTGRVQKTETLCSTSDAPVIKVMNPGRRPWVFCVNMNCPSRGKELLTKPIHGAKPAEEMPEEPVPELEAQAEEPSTEAPTEVEERTVE